ncbi:MAG: hypothetical protein ACI4S9_08245 [Christensenellales bacterium]
MKKRLLKALTVALFTSLLLTFCGCSGYSSSYRAVAFVHSNTTKSAFMSFSSFEGSMVFKLKCESEDEKITYSAKLDGGSAKVYYDCNGTKTELFSVDSGDEISDIGGTLQKGTVYIIVETSETCRNGRFDFEVK